MSWARQADDTMVPISSKKESLNSGWRLSSSAITPSPSDFPTLATSRLCVRRLCTKMLPGSGNTCVLFCIRRNGAEKIILS